MSAVRRLKLMADYDCWPLWEAGEDLVGNVDPATLPISVELRDRLLRWAERFDAGLNREDPASSEWSSPEERVAFDEEGRDLARALRRELPDGYEFVYFSEVLRRIDDVE